VRALVVGLVALAFAGGADAATLTLGVSAAPVRYGHQATFAGALSPVQSGVPVGIYSTANGRLVGSTATQADGTYSVSLAVWRGGQYTALAQLTPSTSAVSPPAALRMIPRLTARVAGRRVVGARLVFGGRLLPAASHGRLKLTVHGKTRRLRIGPEGRFRLSFPNDRAGRNRWRLALAPASGYEIVRRNGAPTLRGPRLGLGSSGSAVRALERRLHALHFALMRVDGYYGIDTFQAVMAFQKLRGLARTGRVDSGLWGRLSRSGIPKARVPRGTHIEVSKTRQVMFEVVNGKVARVAHVSTGLTGNTPVGRFRVYYLHPGYNAKGMYYSLFFHGNFAIHGYVSVPAYQASHGCVRTPIWYAYGFWSRWARIGTQVMVFA
jgi:N-acetylmuramoyl-L-alanine amidase